MIEPVHGTPYALRHDAPGTDPADGHYAEDWTTVLKLVGEEYQPLRRFGRREDAYQYVSAQLRKQSGIREK